MNFEHCLSFFVLNIHFISFFCQESCIDNVPEYIDLFSRLNQHWNSDSDKANRQLCYLMFRKKRKGSREKRKLSALLIR
jgi:hypothetical protein